MVNTSLKQDTLEVQYMSAMSKQRLKICSNDEASKCFTNPSMSITKHDIYHFKDLQTCLFCIKESSFWHI